MFHLLFCVLLLVLIVSNFPQLDRPLLCCRCFCVRHSLVVDALLCLLLLLLSIPPVSHFALVSSVVRKQSAENEVIVPDIGSRLRTHTRTHTQSAAPIGVQFDDVFVYIAFYSPNDADFCVLVVSSLSPRF